MSSSEVFVQRLLALFRPAWWVCLWRGHDPGPGLMPGERDHVGRPMVCVRCDACDAEMARWQYNRFGGVAARQVWDREAVANVFSGGSNVS